MSVTLLYDNDEFYQIWSWEHVKSETVLYAKKPYYTFLTGFSGLDEAKIRLITAKSHFFLI